MNVALDAMGGDFAPNAVLDGVALAIHAGLPSGVRLVLIGQQAVVAPLLAKQNLPTDAPVDIVHADDIIEMGEHPARAFSQKPHSSIAVGFKLLKEGLAHVFCSAGNTGAMNVGALFSIKAIEGVIRPAIAGFVPQVSGASAIMLDIGANADVKPEMLAQFGELGSLYAQYTLGIAQPRVALMNIGEEEQKGNVVAQAAHQLLKQNRRIQFIGNMEGGDMFTDKADVIVSDGFTGNAMYKLGESLFTIAQQRGFSNDTFIQQTNYEAIGGSPIIGINGNVIIAHGKSTPTAIKNMITLAIRQAETAAYQKIAQTFS